MNTTTHVCPPTQCPYANCNVRMECPECIHACDFSDLVTTHAQPTTHTLKATRYGDKYFWKITTWKFL